MRRRVIVTYDISDAKRLRATFKTLRDFGDHLQLSVFECLLNDMERTRLEDRLREVIHEREDQVLFFDLGPATSEEDPAVRAMGRPYVAGNVRPVVV